MNQELERSVANRRKDEGKHDEEQAPPIVKVRLNSGLYDAIVLRGRQPGSQGRLLVKLLDHPELDVVAVLPSSIILKPHPD